MKQQRRNWIQPAILILLGGSVVLTLLMPQLSIHQNRPYPLEVSVVIRGTDSDIWWNTRMGMEEAAKEFGADVRFLTLNTANSSDDQEALIRWEVENGADALVLVPVDPRALKGRLDELANAHPVVTMESAVEGAVATLAPDNKALGGKLAQAVLADWSSGTVLLLNTAPESEGISARLRGAKEQLERAGIPTLQHTLSVEDLGEKLPEIVDKTGAEWVMAFEPSATERAAELKETREQFPALYGVGSTSKLATWLEEGVLSATVAWSDYAVGYLAVRNGLAAVRGVSEKIGPIPFFVVRGEDMYEPEMQKLLFPVMG